MEAWGRLCELGECLRGSGSVAERQEAWLLRCLLRNRDTEYGRLHGFAEIRTPSDYCSAVPVVSYEDIAPWVMQIERGKSDVLFVGQPVAFERTGGSSGGKKLIPYSAASLVDFRAAILPWISDAASTFDLGNGCAYWSISPAARGSEFTAGGAPVGLADGAYLGEDALPAFASLSAVPGWVGDVRDVTDWKLATLYWLVRRDDLVLLSVWSPTFLLGLLDGLDTHRLAVESLLREGGVVGGREVLPDVAAAQRLQAYVQNGDAQLLWPELSLVSCWADASSGPFFEALKYRLPHSQFQGKGLLATEGVVSVPDRTGHPVVAADSGFFEFFDDSGKSWLAHQLETGERYEVVMTTSGGLYRYRTGDRVVCSGYTDGKPRLRFVGRNGLVSDLVGEKLTDEFVDGCLESIPGFRMLVPAGGAKPRYVLVVDDSNDSPASSLLETVEARLGENPQYAYARAIGQLGKLDLLRAVEPLATYVDRVTAHGVRLGDVKIPALRPEKDWLFSFRERGV